MRKAKPLWKSEVGRTVAGQIVVAVVVSGSSLPLKSVLELTVNHRLSSESVTPDKITWTLPRYSFHGQ
jgi:hypothetical protein